MIVTPETLVKEQCQTELNVVLAKYGFILDPFMHVTAAGMAVGINLVPAKPRVQVPVGEGRADG